MIGRLFRRTSERERAIEALHVRVNAASREPGLYTRLRIPDTVEGRFESLCLHAILTLRALRRLPPPGEEVAQELVDSVFRQLDASLRELGIGDFGVPKRMKKLAQSFYGRATFYAPGLDAGDPDALAAALARNVLGGEDIAAAAPLAAYALAAERALRPATLETLLGEGPRLPRPEAFAEALA